MIGGDRVQIWDGKIDHIESYQVHFAGFKMISSHSHCPKALLTPLKNQTSLLSENSMGDWKMEFMYLFI